jgi:hypothetical protein
MVCFARWTDCARLPAAVPAPRGSIAGRAPGDVRIEQFRELVKIRSAKRSSDLLGKPFDVVTHLCLPPAPVRLGMRDDEEVAARGRNAVCALDGTIRRSAVDVHRGLAAQAAVRPVALARSVSRGWFVVAVATVLGVCATVIGGPRLQIYTGAAPPTQFYRAVSTPPIAAGPIPLGVAHNAGNHPHTTRAAVRYGAYAVEVDVRLANGQLVAGRPQPWQWLADALFQGPTLAQVWTRTPRSTAVQLDLKDTGTNTLQALVDFLGPRVGSRQVIVSSRKAAPLLYLRRHLPGIQLMFSAAWPEAVAQLYTDRRLLAAVDAVSLFHPLADQTLVSWLHAHDVAALAWPVNDVRSLHRLTEVGVDAVATDNLALLDALARDHQPTASANHEPATLSRPARPRS